MSRSTTNNSLSLLVILNLAVCALAQNNIPIPSSGSSNQGLPAGAIVGIIIGIVVAGILIDFVLSFVFGVGIVAMCRRRKGERRVDPEDDIYHYHESGTFPTQILQQQLQQQLLLQQQVVQQQQLQQRIVQQQQLQQQLQIQLSPPIYSGAVF